MTPTVIFRYLINTVNARRYYRSRERRSKNWRTLAPNRLAYRVFRMVSVVTVSDIKGRGGILLIQRGADSEKCVNTLKPAARLLAGV